MRLEYVGAAIVLLPLLIALWARATGREGLFRFVVATLMFAVASLISLVTLTLAYFGVNGGGVALLFAGVFVPIGGLLSFLLWVRFFGGLWAKPEPRSRR